MGPEAMRNRYAGRRFQRGAVAIITALSLVVLVGFAGLALDGGHLYLTKTELQNAADACALSASYELTGSPIPAENFTRAENAGKTVGAENRVDFQGDEIDAATIEVSFASSLSGGSWVSAGSAGGDSKYVRCTIARTGIVPWFMQVLGFGDQTVSAFATATLAPAQSNCAIPMALCTDSIAGGSAPHYGYIKGQWYSMNFKETGGGTGVDNLTGNFRWIDFDPSASTPGCSGGGAQELACLLKGAGQCSLPGSGPSNCSGASPGNPIAGCVGQTGNITSLGQAFNTRFGIYQGGSGVATGDLTAAPPDFTGHAYTTTTWPGGSNAYNDFLASRAAHSPVQSSEKPPGTSAADSSQLESHGADRRLVTLPLVECSSFSGSQQAPIRGYACILMLSPYAKSGQDVMVNAEYLGRSNEAGSPCATSGAVGGSTSVGPMVPALVQ